MSTKSPALVLVILAGCHSSSDSDPAPEPVSLVLNLGVAAERLYGAGEQRLVAVSEEGEGRHLDGDGDTTDVVLHLLGLEHAALANTALAFPRRFARDEVPPPEFGCNDALAVFQVSEEETGRDLDGSGFADGVATWVLNWRTGLSRMPFAHSVLALGGDIAAFLTVDEAGQSGLQVYDGRDDSLTALPLEPSALLAVQDGIVAFTRAEEGVSDLNADGDATDFNVLHLLDVDSGRVVNSSFAIVPFTLRIQDGFAGFSVAEHENGGLDLNGDGDAVDAVFVAVEARNGLTRIPGFTGALVLDLPNPDANGFLLTLFEQDLDRNGDGDTSDLVALFYEPRSDRIVDTALAVSGFPPVQAGAWIGVPVGELDQGELDLDGDGRIESIVPHVFDTRTGRSVNLGFRGHWLAALEEQLLGVRLVIDFDVVLEVELFAWDPRALVVRRTGVDASSVLGSSGDRALVVASETTQDLNDDGDMLDLVLAIYEGRTGMVRSLRVATSVSQGGLAPGGKAAVLVSEQGQGADLNGDGDQVDQVLHQIFLDAPLQ